MSIKINNKKRGFTLVEMLVYSMGMVVLLSAIIYFIIQIYGLYKTLTLPSRVDRVGVLIVDRLLKDIRSGESINLAQSEFNDSTGSITINAKENTVSVEKKMAYVDGRISYQENGGTINYLTPDDVSVSRFELDQITTPISNAVRVEIEITYEVNKEVKVRNYRGVAILRQSYE